MKHQLALCNGILHILMWIWGKSKGPANFPVQTYLILSHKIYDRNARRRKGGEMRIFQKQITFHLKIYTAGHFGLMHPESIIIVTGQGIGEQYLVVVNGLNMYYNV